MPRPPSLWDRELIILTYYDSRLYPDHPPEEAHDFIVYAYAKGPILEPNLRSSTTKKIENLTSTEMLELRSSRPISKKRLTKITKDIENDDQVELTVEFSHFESDWTGDHDFRDLPCAGVARFGVRDSRWLSVEVDFTDGWPFDFAMDYFAKQAKPDSITHCEHRMWQLLAYLSPKLLKQVRLETGKQRLRTIYPHLDMLGSRINEWKLCAPGPYPASDVRNREHILACLARDDYVFNRTQIQIILAEENLAGWDDNMECHPRVLAKDTTVNKLIADSGTPNIGGKYAALHIRNILIPHAIQRPKSRARYQDLREELIDLGVHVPDMPTVP